ncbi:MAG: outer membrane beta-barrel domain-containing protein [Pseudomonadales bacterium]
MENWYKRVLLVAALWIPAASALAQIDAQVNVVDPDIERKDIDIDAIDREDFEIGVYYGILSIEDFGSDSVVGVRAAYHITETFFMEASYGSSTAGETSFEALSGSAQLLTDDQRDFEFYNASLGLNILPGETFIGDRWAFNTALYVIGGIGSTEFGGDERFTINFGAGYRLLLNDWLAFHVDVRDHLFDSDLLGSEKTTHNIELSAGFSVFF